jgi:hypothetical protein
VPTSIQPAIPERALNRLRHSIAEKGTTLIAESGIVFVCGARQAPNKDGARDRLVQYAKKHLQGFDFFMAEDVFDAWALPTRPTLLRIERLLADYSDCIIMILETPSVFAELGAFSAHKPLVKKLLVINDVRFKKTPSFVTLGPLAEINARSRFKPVIYTDLSSILGVATAIKETLASVRRQKGQRVDLSSLQMFQSATAKHRMLFLRDVVWLFAPLRITDLVHIFRELYGKVRFDVHLHIRLLSALGFVYEVKKSGYYFPSLLSKLAKKPSRAD